MADRLSTLYRDLLDGTYDCVDRIVLNADFRLGHNPGGFRTWWRRLTGSDAGLDNAHLMRMAGRFSRRLRAYANAHHIPVIDGTVRERKHQIAEKLLETTTVTEGVFLILVGKAQAPVWDVTGLHHLERKRPIPYVNHYSFHILDRDGGHLTIKISGHPPFPAQVILNGHEWVACQVRKAGIQFRKEGAHRQDHPGLSAPAALPAPAREERTDMGRHRRETCDDLTIFKLHCGRVTLKIYTKGERVLRIEAVAHKTQALGRRALAAFPSLVAELNAILERFVDALACIDHCFIGGEILDALPLPSEVGHTKVGGIDLNKPRMQWVATAVLALALTPRGFTASDLARQVQRLGRSAASAYTPRSAAYDLKKLRGKHLVHRIEGTRRDAATVTGLRTLATVTVLRTQIIRPLLAAAELTPSANAAPQATPLDRHYEALRAGMHGVFHELGIAA